jgi:Tol biopolymer transport system component
MAVHVRRYGPYDIVSSLSASRMGEVYLARDTRLQRDVVLKILPKTIAADPDGRERFLQEARAAGALNHPNIVAIFDVSLDGDVPFLVTEFVDGKTLRAELERGPLPVERAVDLGAQIADALAAAHDAGIVHRDLKPENVMVAHEGRAKVLDFGIAKTVPQFARAHGVAAKTETGLIIGTVPYMSPEQARGGVVDYRSDQFSFGILLSEMATGVHPFRRATAVQTLSAIIEDAPRPLAELKRTLPAPVRWVIERCLSKDPGERYASTTDLARDLASLRVRLADPSATLLARPRRGLAGLRQALKWVDDAQAPSGQAIVAAGGRRRRRLALLAGTGVLIATVIVIATMMRARRGPGGFVFDVTAPENVRFNPSSAFMTLSPDGDQLAFAASSIEGGSVLWLRSRDSVVPRQLPGTGGAYQPFWSSNGRFLAFGTKGLLKTIELSTGVSQTLAETSMQSGAWNDDGIILFALPAPERRLPARGIYRISSSGGPPTPATTLDPSRGETAHGWPQFLPDGRRFLYLARSTDPRYDGTVCVGSLDSGERVNLFNADSHAQYASGYLLFMRGSTLLAQQLDHRSVRPSGEAIAIAENIERNPGSGRGAFTASSTAVLAYRRVAETQLVWYDRNGRSVGSVGSPGRYANPSLSADEQRIAVERVNPETGRSDVWIIEPHRQLESRFTFHPGAGRPLWSPDGSRIVFDTESAFIVRSSSGTGGDKRLLEGITFFESPVSWSPDGSALIYEAVGTAARDLWMLPLSGAQKPIPLATTEFREVQGQVSPDGQWLAYVSDEGGRFDVYVRPFPSGEGKWLISATGGIEPVWRRDGKELFYLAPDRFLMAVPMTVGTPLERSAPTRLFQTKLSMSMDFGHTRNQYVVSADGQRFLVNEPAGLPAPITVVVNWTAMLKKEAQ